MPTEVSLRNMKRNATTKYLAFALGTLVVILFGRYVSLSTKYEFTLSKISWHKTGAKGIIYDINSLEVDYIS